MKYLKVGLLFLILFTLGFGFLVAPRIIIIKKITCSNQYGRCDDSLVADLGTVLGKSLAEAKSTLKSILSENLLVKDFSLQYKIPETLQIYILIKKPKFALWSPEEKKGVLVDEEGMVLTEVESTNLPKVIISGKLLVRGEKVNQNQLFALLLMADLNYFYQVKQGVLTDDRFEVNLLEGKKIIFPLEGDRQILLGSLKVVLSEINLSRLNQEAKDSKIERIREIDLRFKNPILK